MIINEAKRFLQTDGLDNVPRQFSIQQGSKAFEILSSNIYSDKPLAVVREYACNAWDSHVEAGKTDVPIEVHIPNTLEPYFYIRDFGVGISEDNIYSIYTVYFNSTKGSNNQLIGALGLGCKSAFAYVDQFMIESIHGGRKKSYAAFIGPDGTPTVTKVNDEVSLESNGVKIQVPVKPSDFGVFLEKTRDIFKRFPVMPVLVGTDEKIEPIDYVFKSVNFAMKETGGSYYYSYRGQGAVAVQGNVPYPIKLDVVSDQLDDLERKILESSAFDLFFPLGSLNISASREALHYDENTKKSIVAVVKEIKSKIKEEFEKQIAEAPTLWKAKQIALYTQPGENNGGLTSFAGFIRGQTFLYQGQEITPDKIQISVKDFGVDTEELLSGQYYIDRMDDYRHLQKRICRYKRHDMIGVYPKENTFIVFDDKKVPSFKRTVIYYFADLLDSKKIERDFNIYMVKVPVGQEAAVLEALGNPPASQVYYTSNMPEPPKKVNKKGDPSTYKAIRQDKMNAVIELRQMVHNNNWRFDDWTAPGMRKSVKFGDGGFYMKVNNHLFLTDTVMFDENKKPRASYGDDLIVQGMRAAINMGLVPKNLYAVNNTEEAALKESGADWKNFLDVLPGLVEQHLLVPENMRKVSLYKSTDQLQKSFGSMERLIRTIFKNDLSKGKLKPALESLWSAYQNSFPTLGKDKMFTFPERERWDQIESLELLVQGKTKKPLRIKSSEEGDKVLYILDNYYPQLIPLAYNCSFHYYSETSEKVTLLKEFIELCESVYKRPKPQPKKEATI